MQIRIWRLAIDVSKEINVESSSIASEPETQKGNTHRIQNDRS